MSQILAAHHIGPSLIAQPPAEQACMHHHLPIEETGHMSKQDSKSASIRDNEQGRRCLQSYETYLRERHEKHGATFPAVATLFKELRGKGYLGPISSLRKFITEMRREKQYSKAFLRFHADYLIKRVNASALEKPSTRQLFEEITERGYQGSIGNLQKFMTKTYRKKVHLKHPLRPYEDYLIERVKGGGALSGNRMFRELQEKGYRGSLKTVRIFLKVMRSKYVPPEAFLNFHEDYLIKRIKEAQPHYVSNDELVKEIRERGCREKLRNIENFLRIIRKELAFKKIAIKGYKGSIETVQTFLTTMHSRGGSLAEHSLSFHKDYLVKKIKESHPNDLSALSLFEEIKRQGYRGTLRDVRMFVSATRREEHRPEALLDFHKDYLIKRLQKNFTSSLSADCLFEEIKRKGYRGTLGELRIFVSTVHQNDRYSKVFFRSHKDYVIKRLQKTPFISEDTLLKELKGEGYQGSLRTLQPFVRKMRKGIRLPESWLDFHRDYLIEGIKGDCPKSSKELFEEIKRKGYWGSLSSVQRFLKTVRKSSVCL